MIFHIPHSSRSIPEKYREGILLDGHELATELFAMTDAYTDDLFGAHATTDDSIIQYPVSRLVLDPERFEQDDDEPMAKIGMGVIYTATSFNGVLRDKPTPETRQKLLDTFYHPHHQNLEMVTTKYLEQQGCSLIIDCHSFPSSPLPYELNRDSQRPDICIGIDSFHTSGILSEALKKAVSCEGFSCKENSPFAGTMVPSRYYMKDQRVQSIMIEVNRSLYMDERTGERSLKYPEIKHRLGRIINHLRSFYSTSD
jgi:N-formylglutamate amidohydrolase